VLRPRPCSGVRCSYSIPAEVAAQSRSGIECNGFVDSGPFARTSGHGERKTYGEQHARLLRESLTRPMRASSAPTRYGAKLAFAIAEQRLMTWSINVRTQISKRRLVIGFCAFSVGTPAVAPPEGRPSA
jgi:hypothetical protein